MDENKGGDRPDYRSDRNDRSDNRYPQNRNRSNRFRHGQHGGGFQGRGRLQRPLLTSSINGAGLTLIALVAVKTHPDTSYLASYLSLAVIAFGMSALVSYVAQRIKPKIIEIISDVFFLAGAIIIIYSALRLGGLV
ncbi:MAG: hypothetical protein JWQ35_710 [Bacteriovoracaceae bacterium]|nr:hypothetical protein [Bacteriovoracaceae bacterium]